MKKKNFTLSELVVVVSIVFLLIALICPTVSRAVGDAAERGCRDNLNKQSKAVAMYSGDYQGFLPPGYVKTISGDGVNGKDRRYSYPGNLAQYLEIEDSGERDLYSFYNSQPVLQCPEAKTNAIGYAVNRWLTVVKKGRLGVYKTSEITRPAEAILLLDYITWTNCTAYKFATGGKAYEKYLMRHAGAANIAFVDGHVDSRRIKEINYGGSPNANNKAFTTYWSR